MSAVFYYKDLSKQIVGKLGTDLCFLEVVTSFLRPDFRSFVDVVFSLFKYIEFNCENNIFLFISPVIILEDRKFFHIYLFTYRTDSFKKLWMKNIGRYYVRNMELDNPSLGFSILKWINDILCYFFIWLVSLCLVTGFDCRSDTAAADARIIPKPRLPAQPTADSV